MAAPAPLSGFYDCSLFIARITVDCPQEQAFAVLARIAQDFSVVHDLYSWEDGTLTVLVVTNEEGDRLNRQVRDLCALFPGQVVEFRVLDVTRNAGWEGGWRMKPDGTVTDLHGNVTSLTDEDE